MAGKRARAEQAAAAKPLPALVALVPCVSTGEDLAVLLDRAAHWPVSHIGHAVEILPVIAAELRTLGVAPLLAQQLDSDAQRDPKTLGHHRAYLESIAHQIRTGAA